MVTGMHAGCQREQQVEDAAKEGFHGVPKHEENGGD